MDYIFWITYLLPVGIGLWGGWWLRGVREYEHEMARYRLMREVEQAKQRHPAYRAGRWERG